MASSLWRAYDFRDRRSSFRQCFLWIIICRMRIGIRLPLVLRSHNHSFLRVPKWLVGLILSGIGRHFHLLLLAYLLSDDWGRCSRRNLIPRRLEIVVAWWRIFVRLEFVRSADGEALVVVTKLVVGVVGSGAHRWLIRLRSTVVTPFRLLHQGCGRS